MSGSVAVVGSLNVDLVVSLERMPGVGETVLASAMAQHPGGKGLNQAVASARLGAPTAMVGALGRDAAADVLRGVLADEGIGADHIVAIEGPSGAALIEVDSTGANRIVVVPAANGEVSPDDVSFALGALRPAVLLTQSEIPPAATLAALAAGRAVGATTIWNPAPAPTEGHVSAALEVADIIVPNEHEAEALTGIATTDADGVVAAAQDLVRRGARHAIVTCGGRGAVLVSAEAVRWIEPFAVDAIDSVAAGDAFCGALAAGLAAGIDVHEAVRWASAAGALATTVAGAVPSLPRRDAVASLVSGEPAAGS